jgi:hypothetical protein
VKLTERTAVESGGPRLLWREAQILEEAGRRLLERASEQLRSGRSTWEPWFEAGMELQDAAKRLRSLAHDREIAKS